jgi:hypothetical protein
MSGVYLTNDGDMAFTLIGVQSTAPRFTDVALLVPAIGRAVASRRSTGRALRQVTIGATG